MTSVGPAPSSQSYLVVDNILAAARATGRRVRRFRVAESSVPPGRWEILVSAGGSGVADVLPAVRALAILACLERILEEAIAGQEEFAELALEFRRLDFEVRAVKRITMRTPSTSKPRMPAIPTQSAASTSAW